MKHYLRCLINPIGDPTSIRDPIADQLQIERSIAEVQLHLAQKVKGAIVTQ